MNTTLRRLAPLLLLILGLGLPAGAMRVALPGSAGRTAVRAQIPVIMNAYFSAPTPVNGAALLSALSLSGGDPRVNQAVRLRVADVLSALDIETSRVANAPGAANLDDAVAQSRVSGVIAYRAQVLETLQLPHVSQHLTKAQRADVAARAVAAGVALTPEKTAALVARAQGEIEKLIAGTRGAQSVETGASAGHIGVTPRGAKLGKHVPQDPAALARAAIPSPAALAAHQDKRENGKHFVRLSGVLTAALALATASAWSGLFPLLVLSAAAFALTAATSLLVSMPVTHRFGVSLSRALPGILFVGAAFAAAQALKLYAPPGAFDAVAALVLGGFGIAAGRGARRGMSLVFRVASAVSMLVALGAFFPGLPQATSVMIALASFVMTSLASAKPTAPRGSLLVALTALAAALATLVGLPIAGFGAYVLWNVAAQAAATGLMTVAAGMITGFGLFAVGALMISVLTPMLMLKAAALREAARGA